MAVAQRALGQITVSIEVSIEVETEAGIEAWTVDATLLCLKPSS